MDTLSAYARMLAFREKPLMVFDWDRAARRIVETGAQEARAGLREDWESTGGRILRNGQPVPREETSVYLASKWAVPELALGWEIEPCFRMEADTPGWDADTYWPDSARAILRGDA